MATLNAELVQKSSTQGPSPHLHKAKTSSGQQQRGPPDKHSSQISDADLLANISSRSAQNLGAQPNLISVEGQLARVQTFCVYASELVDAQREDINRVSAAVERVETELKSFKEFLGEIREERRAQKSSGITSEEVDLLTSSMGEIGRKANEVDALKLEIAMMKGKIKRLEHAFQLPQPASIQPFANTDSESAQASRSHSDFLVREHGQTRNQGAPERIAKQGAAAPAPNLRVVGKNKRPRSLSGEAITRHTHGNKQGALVPPAEASHSSPFSLRPRRPEQLRPYLATATLSSEDDDEDSSSGGSSGSSDSKDNLLSPPPLRSRTGRAPVGPVRAPVRGHGHSPGQLWGSLPDHTKAFRREQDYRSAEKTNGHGIPSGATNRTASDTLPRIKQEGGASRPPSQKENLKLTESGKIHTRGRPPKKRKKEHLLSRSRGGALDQDDVIRARERALDGEWGREYGPRDRG